MEQLPPLSMTATGASSQKGATSGLCRLRDRLCALCNNLPLLRQAILLAGSVGVGILDVHLWRLSKALPLLAGGALLEEEPRPEGHHRHHVAQYEEADQPGMPSQDDLMVRMRHCILVEAVRLQWHSFLERPLIL